MRSVELGDLRDRAVEQHAVRLGIGTRPRYGHEPRVVAVVGCGTTTRWVTPARRRVDDDVGDLAEDRVGAARPGYRDRVASTLPAAPLSTSRRPRR